MAVEFTPFPKLARLSKPIVITEKIDGTNAGIIITEDGEVWAQSRNRLLTLYDDNYGFAKWVQANEDALREGLGVGVHFGEWWGKGVQKRYKIEEKRFSLFNVSRWKADEDDDFRCIECPVCHVVPTLALCPTFDTLIIDATFELLRVSGSHAVKGAEPEGIVVYHEASKTLFKKTYEYDAGKWTGAN